MVRLLGYCRQALYSMPKGSRSRKNRKQGGRSHKTGNIDLNKQSANLHRSGSDTLTWSIESEAMPRFGSTLRFDNKIFNIMQMAAPVTVLTTSNVASTFGVFTFTATNSVAQFASWSNVFDQYRIMELEVWISADISNTTGISLGAQNLYTVTDYDDGNALTTITQALSYANVIAAPLTNGQYRKWRPHMATAAYSGVFTSFKNEVSNWIDVASPGVQHYGLKLAADVTTTNAINIRMFTRVWIQFRNVF